MTDAELIVINATITAIGKALIKEGSMSALEVINNLEVFKTSVASSRHPDSGIISRDIDNTIERIKSW